MTDEEINRKFDTVAGHLATLAGSQQRYEERWGRTEESIRALLVIAQMHEGEISTLKEALAESQARTDRQIAETSERLNALINTVERYISKRQNGDGKPD
jgi:hypothetical protein